MLAAAAAVVALSACWITAVLLRPQRSKRSEQAAAAERWALQDRAKIKVLATSEANERFPAPPTCLVTGGSGMVGRRVIELLLERGAQRVVCFDLCAPAAQRLHHSKVEYVIGDICDKQALEAACKGIDTVFHIAALVGPFFTHAMYEPVNYQGTLNVIAACRACGVKKLVDCSSPSTRFPGGDFGGDITGQGEDELPYPSRFSHEYARTKALGERAVLEAAAEPPLLTCAVAPHQVYGPTDQLFVPAMLDTARSGRLRIFGDGQNWVSFTHMDNIAHGLLCAANALKSADSPANGKFFVVTDGSCHNLWATIDSAVVQCGFTSLAIKWHLPLWLLYPLAYIGTLVTALTGRFVKLSPFTIRMLVINRYFDISRSRDILQYRPIVAFEDGWRETVEAHRKRRAKTE